MVAVINWKSIEDTTVIGLDENKTLQLIDVMLNSVRPVKVQELVNEFIEALKIHPDLTIKLITYSSVRPYFEVPRDVLDVAKEKLAKKLAMVEGTKEMLQAHEKEVQQLTAAIASIENSKVGQ